MLPELSIVILVYKTAHLLKRCLDSLTGQTAYDPDAVEIVIVSDHSPDNADEVVAEYRRKHPEIKYIVRQNNGGEAPARNTGFSHCTGRYYTYVDSDDCVTSDYLLEILRIIRKYGPDMLTYRYETCNEEGRFLSVIKTHPAGICEPAKSQAARRLAFKVFAMNLRCNAVYRRALVQDLRYREEYKLGVDALFAFESYLRSRRFYVCNAVLYRYYQYAQSATHNFDAKRLIDMMLVHGVYLEKILRQPYFDLVKRDLFYFFASNYLTWIASEAARFPFESPVGNAFRRRFGSILQEARMSGAICSLHAAILLWLTRTGRYGLLRRCMIAEKALRVIQEKL